MLGVALEKIGPEVKHERRWAEGCKIQIRGSSRFSVRLAEKIEQAEAKTNKDQMILKRQDPAFIEPMQCKPVTALPAGEKWTFEIKLDGYRCIAVKRAREVTLFSRHNKVLNRRFPGVAEAIALSRGRVRSRRRTCRLGFTRQTFISPSTTQYFAVASDILLRLPRVLNQNGQLLVNLCGTRPFPCSRMPAFRIALLWRWWAINRSPCRSVTRTSAWNSLAKAAAALPEL